MTDPAVVKGGHVNNQGHCHPDGKDKHADDSQPCWGSPRTLYFCAQFFDVCLEIRECSCVGGVSSGSFCPKIPFTFWKRKRNSQISQDFTINRKFWQVKLVSLSTDGG